MASKRKPYITKKVRTGPLQRSSKLGRLVAKGWEVTAERHIGMSGVTEHTLRLPNPKYVGASK